MPTIFKTHEANKKLNETLTIIKIEFGIFCEVSTRYIEEIQHLQKSYKISTDTFQAIYEAFKTASLSIYNERYRFPVRQAISDAVKDGANLEKHQDLINGFRKADEIIAGMFK